MYYLFLLMLNSKKLISLSLASALVLSLPLNSLAIGVNDASNYVTSSAYTAKIAELETRIADLEANQNTTDVNTALQDYFNDETTSPIVAGDYITISNNNGKKMISASSKPTTITAGDNHIEVTKNETDSDITFTLKQKSNSYTSNFSTSASSQGVLNAALRVIPDGLNEAWVSGSGKFDLAMLKNNGPLYSGATGTIDGTYKVHLTNNFVSAEIYDSNGLFAVGYSQTTDFRSVTNLAFNGVRVTNSASGLPLKPITLSLQKLHDSLTLDANDSFAYDLGQIKLIKVKLIFHTTADMNENNSSRGDALFKLTGVTICDEPVAIACSSGFLACSGMWYNQTLYMQHLALSKYKYFIVSKTFML